MISEQLMGSNDFELGLCDLLGDYCLIRGEPERAPNTRVTYGEFAVPMYVCIYVCM